MSFRFKSLFLSALSFVVIPVAWAAPVTIFDWENVVTSGLSVGWQVAESGISGSFYKGDSSYVMNSIRGTSTSGYAEELYCSYFEALAKSSSRFNVTNGYTFTIDMQMVDELHTGANGANRAGFNVIIVDSTSNKSLELGFWMDKIQSQYYDRTISGPGEFRFETGANVDTAVMQKYSVTALGNAFSVYDASGNKLLGYMLQDLKGYATINMPVHGETDPYSLKGFLYVGDNTHSAAANTNLQYMTYDGSISKQGQVTSSTSADSKVLAAGLIYSSSGNLSEAMAGGAWQAMGGGSISAGASNFVNATGNYRYSLLASGEGSAISATDITISSQGMGAHGAYAENGARIELLGNTTIAAGGDSSYAVGAKITNGLSAADIYVGVSSAPSSAGGVVVRLVSGEIITTGASGIGIYAETAGGGKIRMDIASGVSVSSFGANSVGVASQGGSFSGITNKGEIVGATGIAVYGAQGGRVVNEGSITGKGGIAVNIGSSDVRLELRSGSNIAGDVVLAPNSGNTLAVYNGNLKIDGAVDLQGALLEIAFDTDGSYGILWSTGSINILGTELYLDFGDVLLNLGQSFNIIQSDTSIDGTFLGLDDGDTFYVGTKNQYELEMHYGAKTAWFDVIGMTPIPEPGGYSVFAGILAVGFACCRRKRM